MPEDHTATIEAEQLLRQARNGDDRALGHLLEQHGSYLTLLARVQIGRYLQSKVDPGDLVQDTFLEAHRHFERFRGKTAAEFSSWLRQILAGVLGNVVRHYVGTQARDVRLEREIAAGLDHSSAALEGALVDPRSSPSQQTVRREQTALLADALTRLPADYRDVIVLRQLQGLSFAEVAQKMGRSEDSVQKLWVRALSNLRRTFGSSP